MGGITLLLIQKIQSWNIPIDTYYQGVCAAGTFWYVNMRGFHVLELYLIVWSIEMIIYLIFKLGLNAQSNSSFHSELWDLNNIYCEDTISDSGRDWNFEQHKKTNTEPAMADFEKTIGRRDCLQIKCAEALQTICRQAAKKERSSRLEIYLTLKQHPVITKTV